MADYEKLQKLSKLIRYYILYMTTKAGSGHATSSLSAADLMTYLFFEKLRFDVANPKNLANDRVIFSKGHASPLLYALWTTAGAIDEKDLDSYRQFGSKLEGHPTPRFEFVDAATGSLGQGLSIGLGLTLGLRAGPVSSFPPAPSINSGQAVRVYPERNRRAVGSLSTTTTRTIENPTVYVLLGDSEVAEGSVWEAVELASYYKVSNLVGIMDVNRLGQSTETMLGWDVSEYKKRFEAFGWEAFVVDGHDFKAISQVFEEIDQTSEKPKVIIAKTVKGKGVSFLEDKEGKHGIALSQEEFERAVKELGEIDKALRAEIEKPGDWLSVLGYQFSEDSLSVDRSVSFKTDKPKTGKPNSENRKLRTDNINFSYKFGEEVATRKAYGEALVRIGAIDDRVVSLDAEVKNSTFAQTFKNKYPERFYEMFIAEQNMVGVALGMSKLGFVPFVSTFAAFFTRAFDQVRMSAISRANIKFVGSHAGVSIGPDGPSQMGLEDFAMFRSVFGSKVFCPADAVACERLIEIAAQDEGLFYIRTQRPATPVIYKQNQKFKIGGSNVLKKSEKDVAVIVACGIALNNALKAAQNLEKKGINVRVVDAYGIKPIDGIGLREAAKLAGSKIVVCEDHYFEGGLGDAVCNVFAGDFNVRIYKLAVSKMPMSGSAEDLFRFEKIDSSAIFKKVVEIVE